VRASVGLVIALALAVPAMTRAGALECESRAIGAQDARKMMKVARRTAGSLRLVKSSLVACMNPGRGRAWYDAQPVPQLDGSVLRPHVVCHREEGPWSCEIQQKRTARIDVERDGRRLLYEFELPPWLEVDDARRLTKLAFELGPTLLNSQQCAWKTGSTNAGEGEQKAFSGASFDPADSPGSWKIVEEKYGVAVIFGTHIMTFVLSPDHNAWRFICWGDWIEVS
jgi:hypothetical protein